MKLLCELMSVSNSCVQSHPGMNDPSVTEALAALSIRHLYPSDHSHVQSQLRHTHFISL